MTSKDGVKYSDFGMPLPPCHKCSNRNEDCHSRCARYEAYRKAQTKKNEADKFTAQEMRCWKV